MQRARRLASAVVVASLTVGGLSACRSEPAVAAYLGENGRITEARVQEVWDEAYDAVAAQAPQPAGAAEPSEAAAPPSSVVMPISRADIVGQLVSRDVYARVAEQRRITLPADLPYAEAGGQVGLPATSEYVRLYTENVIMRNQLEKAVTTPAEPTEADLRDVYQRFAANGGLEPGMDFAAFTASVPPEAKQALGSAITIRNDVQAVADDLKIQVNPRYQPLELGMYGISDSNSGRVYQIVAAALGEDERTPVLDVS